MRPELQFIIAPDHPSIAGHFPGRPVVPGIVLLNEAIALLLRNWPGRHVAALREVKFLSPVIPGDAVTIDVIEMAPDRMSFVGRVGQQGVFRARVELDVAA